MLINNNKQVMEIYRGRYVAVSENCSMSQGLLPRCENVKCQMSDVVLMLQRMSNVKCIDIVVESSAASNI